ncbi:MAG: BatA domain-containing protein [Aureliella sp.]
MSFLQPLMLIALPMIALPVIIHLINQWRYQTKPWGAMMFLLQANQMNRGLAKVRQWLILAMRTLAVAGLIFAVARPLSSGLFGLAGGGKIDTAIVLLDRSPSMQQLGESGESKLQAAQRQLADALETVGAEHFVAILPDGTATEYQSAQAMFDSPELAVSSAETMLPTMLSGTLDYLQANKPGPTEVWICSDLRASDWSADDGAWSLAREGLQALPQSVSLNLLAYPEPASENLAVRVTSARRAPREDDSGADDLLLSISVTRTEGPSEPADQDITIEIDVGGARSSIVANLTGNQVTVRNHRIPLAGTQTSGWGKVSIPADSNPADNDYYFVFDDPPLRRVVVVTDNGSGTRAVEIAASVTDEGTDNPAVEVLVPAQLDSLTLDDTSLLVWKATLPDEDSAPAVADYIEAGGQVIFFPPEELLDAAEGLPEEFLGVRWSGWVVRDDAPVMVQSWRGDQDLLAATASGVGLPVGQLKLNGYATIESESEISRLASLPGGESLLAKLPTDSGAVYFCATTADPNVSSLAQSGVVLFVAIQRAIARGQEALGRTTARTAREDATDTTQWQQVLGEKSALSTQFASTAGVYQVGEQRFAVNRPSEEDQPTQLEAEQVEALFAGLQFSRVDASAGDLGGIVREIWRLFLVLMIVALLLEAVLCLPRQSRNRATSAAEGRGNV